MSNSEGCTGAACPSPPQLQLYQTLIFAAPVLFAFMLLLMFCFLYFRRHRRAASIHSHIRAQIFAESLFTVPPLEQGLCAVIRERLPVIYFNDEFRATYKDLQCAICLGDYETNEKLLQLPVCKHSFHVPCINQWLEKKATCPICRLSLNEIKISHAMNSDEVDDVLCEGLNVSRFWEDRVINEVHDSSIQVRSVASNEENIQHTVLSEHEISCTISEHIVNIERS